MKTTEILLTSLLAAAFLSGCTNTEEPAVAGSKEAIRITAGIGQTTRAVIDADYVSDLDVSFARMDNPATAGSWNSAAINATRTGGTGNTAIAFATDQTYLTGNEESALIGYYPRKALGTVSNPASVSYTITGDEDIMATEVQTGALNNKFTSFTFQHLLTQLQFKCIGSTEALKKWTTITSIKVEDVATELKLSLDKDAGATLEATGASDQTLAVKNCPARVSDMTEESPSTGYLMLLPEYKMGTKATAITLEVIAKYDGNAKTQTILIDNITGGVKVGESHLITLTFAEDGTITADAGIAAWKPGNGGSGVVTPNGKDE